MKPTYAASLAYASKRNFMRRDEFLAWDEYTDFRTALRAVLDDKRGTAMVALWCDNEEIDFAQVAQWAHAQLDPAHHHMMNLAQHLTLKFHPGFLHAAYAGLFDFGFDRDGTVQVMSPAVGTMQ